MNKPVPTPIHLCATTIQRLISNLELLNTDEHRIEKKTLRHLTALLKAFDEENKQSIESCVALLRQFWLESIPWCSELSKDVEKVLILYEECSEGQ